MARMLECFRWTALLTFIILSFSTLSFAESLVLSWDPVDDPRLDGYHVYRSSEPQDPFQRLNLALVRDTSFADHAVSPGKTYYYSVSSVGNSGEESGLSTPLAVSLPVRRVLMPSRLDTGLPVFDQSFVGAALLNTARQEIMVTLEGRALEGYAVSETVLDGGLLPSGQISFLTGEVPELRDADIAVAKTDEGSLQGFFMLGGPHGRSMDGIGGRMEAAKQHYLPVARSGDGRGVFIFLYNPSSTSSRVDLTLYFPNGDRSLRQSLIVLPKAGLTASLRQIFGNRLDQSDGYIDIRGDVAFQAFAFDWRGEDYSSLIAQPPRMADEFLAPHFFVGPRIGDSEIRLLNTSDQPVSVTIEAFDDQSSALGQLQRTLGGGQLGIFLASQITGRPAGENTLSGYLRIRLDRQAPMVGAVTFSGRSGSLATLPLEAQGLKEHLFLHVAHHPQEGIFTGLALLNPWDQQTEVTLEAHDAQGMLTAVTTLRLNPRQRIVQLLDEASLLGAGFNQVGGHFRLTSQRPLFSFALLGDYRGRFLAALQSQEPSPR